MKLLGTLSVYPVLPKRLERLNELAYNLWWTWSPAAQALFERIDAALWDSTNHNPVKLLHTVANARLETLAGDAEFLAACDQTLAAFDAYMHPADTWFSRSFPQHQTDIIAYFSAEFGLHEALPIYSGGLGVLAGDHCKSASDLGLPFVGVGFLYPQGYFTQRIAEDGAQQAFYVKLDFSDLPAIPALDAAGREIVISVQLPGRSVYAKVWRLQIGRIPLYLMDTDVELNAPDDRDLSARLYSGDSELRISQEVVLGIGGVRALRALNIHATIFHMNEGHAAFLSLERVRELVQEQHLSFFQAQQAVAASAVFTTHTPVPAGNDAFSFEMIDKFFRNFWGQIGLNREGFMNLARAQTPWGEMFSMTVLAIRFAAHANGVSALHGQVARSMWASQWPDLPLEEVPITHVTNGVHTDTWLAAEMAALYGAYLRDATWRTEPDLPEPWQAIMDVPDEVLWERHQTLKQRMLAFVRERVARQRRRHGESPAVVAAAYDLFDPNAFIIGFARRFATYKRAALIFHDLKRIHRILDSADRPVQIIFAGKAHPADEPGKALIQQVHLLSQTPEFAGRIIFVEDYDMNVARYLVSGVDMWLNTPKRPNEASGTSGQKAALNGIPNASILDGWWAEGFNGSNGWAIGEAREYKNDAIQAEADANSLYNLLENDIVPTYFQRNKQGVPVQWVAVMKEAIRSCAPRFSMSRQVKDYTRQLYLPAAVGGREMAAANYARARDLAGWKERIYTAWPQVRISADKAEQEHLIIGESLALEASVFLGALKPQDVVVELVWGIRDDATLSSIQSALMTEGGALPGGLLRYTGSVTFPAGGRFGYGIRIRPNHPALSNKYELGLMKWA